MDAEVLMMLQRMLMESLQVYGEGLDSPDFMNAAIGLSTESAEVLDLLGTKTRPWKQMSGDVLEAEVKKELVDVMFYLLESFLILGISWDGVSKMYGDKMVINLCRAFASYRDTPRWREETFLRFVSDTSLEETSDPALITLASLETAIGLFFKERSLIDLNVPAFFEDPETYIREWVDNGHDDAVC